MAHEDITLCSGDIVVDVTTGAVGVLMYRYALIDSSYYTEMDEDDNLWAWDVHWTGTHIDETERLQPWTEVGLVNIIKSELFVLYKKD